MERHPTDENEVKYPRTDLEIKACQGEIRIVGTENDLDIMIPALCNAFVVDKVSKRYPRRDEPHRSTVYLTISGVRNSDE